MLTSVLGTLRTIFQPYYPGTFHVGGITKNPRLLIFGCVLKPVAVEEAFLKQKIWTLHILAYERGVDRKVFHKFTSK